MVSFEDEARARTGENFDLRGIGRQALSDTIDCAFSVNHAVVSVWVDGVDRTSEIISGAFASLKALSLDWNAIGADGVSALCCAVLPALVRLGIGSNKVGDAGVARLIEGMGSQSVAMPLLRFIDLSGTANQIGDVGMAALASALSSGAMRGLEELSVWNPTLELKRALTERGI